MNRKEIEKKFNYYFTEVVKEESDEVWDAQEDILDFVEFLMDKKSKNKSSKINKKLGEPTPYSEWVKTLSKL